MNNKVLIITKGLPASGKSTWARKIVANDPTYVRVNRDDLRSMLHDNVWDKNREKVTVMARNALIRVVLASGKNVINDDTNLSPKVVDELRAIALEYGADFQIESFEHVPVETCLERDANREASVGADVIWRMYRQMRGTS